MYESIYSYKYILYLLIAYLRNSQGRYFLENYTIKGALNVVVKRRKHHKISDLIKFDFQKQERILKFSNNLFLKNHNRKETLTLTIENTIKIYQLRKSDFTKKKKEEGNRRPNSQFIQATLETVAFEISSSLQELKFYWKAKGRWSVGVTGSGHPTPGWNGPVGVFPAQP